jgi:hypothetical protein
MKRFKAYDLTPVSGLYLLIVLLVALPASCGAMTITDKNNDVKMEISGTFKACFGGTEHLDFVDGGRGNNADFDATRELAIKFKFIANEYLKGVASFQVGEGSTGGYFGSSDALGGGEEDGDDILELDNLYIDFTLPGTGISFKAGSQSACLADGFYGSHIMSEVPAGLTMNAVISDTVTLQAGWFRMADLLDDTTRNMDDRADLFYAQLPMKHNGIELTPYAAYAVIGDDLIRDGGANFGRYAYFDYPGLFQGAMGSITDANGAMAMDNVTAYYLGTGISFKILDAITVKGTILYGDMDWETAAEDISVAGYFADLVVDYKMGFMTPEIFMFYGSGPDENDTDLNMLPTLIGGPCYTSSFFGGSRFNDNMFDSHDTTYATSMCALGLKLKEIRIGEKLTNEFQLMYAQGTAEDTLFQAPDDILMNDDESFVEVNFNSEYQLMKNFIVATEFGYIIFDEDDDYDEVNGTVEDFWKAALSLEYSF